LQALSTVVRGSGSARTRGGGSRLLRNNGQGCPEYSAGISLVCHQSLENPSVPGSICSLRSSIKPARAGTLAKEVLSVMKRPISTSGLRPSPTRRKNLKMSGRRKRWRYWLCSPLNMEGSREASASPATARNILDGCACISALSPLKRRPRPMAASNALQKPGS